MPTIASSVPHQRPQGDDLQELYDQVLSAFAEQTSPSNFLPSPPPFSPPPLAPTTLPPPPTPPPNSPSPPPPPIQNPQFPHPSPTPASTASKPCTEQCVTLQYYPSSS